MKTKLLFSVLFIFCISLISGCSFVDWLASEENDDSDIDPGVRVVAKILSGLSEEPRIIENIPLDLVLPNYERIDGMILKSGKAIVSDARGCAYLYEHKRISGMTNFYNQYFSYELEEIDSIMIIDSDEYEIIWVLSDDFHDNYAQQNLDQIVSVYLIDEEEIKFDDNSGATDWYKKEITGFDSDGKTISFPFEDIYSFDARATDNTIKLLQSRDMWDYDNEDIWEYEFEE